MLMPVALLVGFLLMKRVEPIPDIQANSSEIGLDL
jgi:hypothetical protein